MTGRHSINKTLAEHKKNFQWKVAFPSSQAGVGEHLGSRRHCGSWAGVEEAGEGDFHGWWQGGGTGMEGPGAGDQG